METESNTEEIKYKVKGHIKIDWGRQGGTIFGYIVVLLGYYGIIANLTMFDQWGHWISFEDLTKFSVYRIIDGELFFLPGRDMLFWTYITYIDTFFLPAILLFLICFILTYKEEIPHYGIKASIWLIPILVIEGFIFYAIMYGFSIEPLLLKFGRIEGYIDIIVISVVAVSGAVAGMKLKQFTSKRRKV